LKRTKIKTLKSGLKLTVVVKFVVAPAKLTLPNRRTFLLKKAYHKF